MSKHTFAKLMLVFNVGLFVAIVITLALVCTPAEETPFERDLAAGKYDRVDPGITEENFPSKGGLGLECVDMHIAEETTSGKSLEIFFCDKRMTSAERVASLERQHYRPASVDDMLAVINQRRDGLDVTTDDYQIKWLPDGAYYRGKSEQGWHEGYLYVASRK